MSVLFCQWGSIIESGITEAFRNLGYNVIPFDYPIKDRDLDTDYINRLAGTLLNTPDIDLIFSINYIPIISKTCKITRTHYISWTVDSPSLPLYSESMNNPYSHAYIFDHALYSRFAKLFPGNVHYLSLGSSPEFYDSVSITASDHAEYDCDISFVGSFHTEFCTNYDNSITRIPDYMKGYTDALINAQLNIYGYYLIEDSISSNMADSYLQYANYTTLPDYIQDSTGIVADHIIGFKCNQQDRIRTLDYLSRYYSIDLYTTEDTSMLPDINNRGIADSSSMMPKIFKCSKINLNITARTIRTGIPQRIFDIMAAGGFVISNYQAEIPEYFIPDEDIVLYDSLSELKDKIQYYLNNENERLRISQNGYNKLKERYTYTIKLAELLDSFKKIYIISN